MARPGLVLVDTSVWVRFFRAKESAEARALDCLLEVAGVATCAPIRAEVVSGAPTQREASRLRELFDALVELPLPADIWRRVEAHRFGLARRGHQASLLDLMIALTAAEHDAALWTLDEDFRAIAVVIPLGLYQPSIGATPVR